MSIPVVSTIACRSHSYWPAMSPSSLNSDSDSDSDISPLLRRSLLLYFIVAHCPVLGPFVYVIQQIENSSMHCEYVPFFSPLYLLCLQIDTIAFHRYIHIYVRMYLYSVLCLTIRLVHSFSASLPANHWDSVCFSPASTIPSRVRHEMGNM